MPRVPASRRTFASAAAIVAALLLAPAPAAVARKLQMSGTWAARIGPVFVPLQFTNLGPGPGTVRTSMGDLSKALGFPNGPIPGSGRVTATGSAPRTLVVPRHRFRTSPFVGIPLWQVTLAQLTTMFVVDAPFETATLRAGGGPGSFQWCPNGALGCPVTGPPNGGTRNGRVIYLAGPSQFGGTMQLGLAGGGVNSFVFNAVPWQIGHGYFRGVGATPRTSAVGRGAPSDPWTRMNYLPPGVVTQPTMAPTFDDLIQYPGPKLTTMLGLTTTGAGPTYRFGTIGTSAMGMPFALLTSEYGFAHTTGTVIVQQTAGTHGDDFFTIMGSDARTPLGAGNISTVAGGISFRSSLSGQSPFATWHKVWMTLGPPVPSLSPAGLAAASALMLLAVGYALRRRAGGRAPNP